MFCTYTWHVKTRCNCSCAGSYAVNRLCWEVKDFFECNGAAQFLNPRHRGVQMCLWCLFCLESGLRVQPTGEQRCLGRGEAEYKRRSWCQGATIWVSVFVRTQTGLTCQGTDWGRSQCYRARGTGTVHHKTKQNQLFVRSPTLRQLVLTLLVNKGCITVHLSQPLDWYSKGLSIRDALVKHKLLRDAEILKWNTATKALQMAHYR